MPQELFWACAPLLAVSGAGAELGPGPTRAVVATLWSDNPLYVHLLINHLPIYGTLMGLLALLLAFVWKSEAGQRIALVLLLVSTAGAWLVFQSGQNAYQDARTMSDDAAQPWITEHLHRAEQGIYVFYFAALLCASALYAGWRKSKWATGFTIAAGIVGLAALGTAGWIADAGGKIRHSELRTQGEAKPP